MTIRSGLRPALSTLVKRGWTVELFPDADHMSGMHAARVLPLLIPWNVVGTIWQIFARSDIGMLGVLVNSSGVDYNYTARPVDAWITVRKREVRA